MQNDPIELLRAEHEIIARAKDTIAAMDGLRTRDAAAYARTASELLSFFTAYSDGYHHKKEESVLFPELRDNRDFYASDVLDELEEHHETFRGHVAGIRKALDEGDAEGAHARLRRYAEELLDHIAVENDELFVMAESLLSEAELDRVFFRFKDVDRELGEERKSELEQRLIRIESSL